MITAESLTIELESLVGEPFAAAATAATRAIAADRAPADLVVFPTALGPLTADLIAKWQLVIGGIAPTGYGSTLAQHHGSELVADPAFAALCRSTIAIDDVAAAAARWAHPMSSDETIADAQNQAAALAVAAYKRTIAAQLSALDGAIGDAARALLACDQLEQRGAAAVARHQAHAAAAVAQIEAEQEAAVRAVAAEHALRVAQAAEAAAVTARAAKAAADAHRAAREEAVRAELEHRLAKAKWPERLALRSGGGGGRLVEELLSDLAGLAGSSAFDAVEAAVAAGKFVEL